MQRKNSPITASDWIVYLQGESSSMISFMFPFCTALLIIYITLVQMNLSIGSELFPLGIEEITFGLLSLILFFAGLILLGIRPYSKLSKKIIKGELKNYKEILNEYINEIEKKNLLTVAWKDMRSYFHSFKKKSKENDQKNT